MALLRQRLQPMPARLQRRKRPVEERCLVTSFSFDNKRILVIVYGHLADTMAAVPALRSLRNAHRTAQIDVVALESTRLVLGPCPYIDRLITWKDFQHK